MGELIDEGGYGCIFYPGISCKNKETKNVSKVQIENFTSKNEIYIGTKIKKIANYEIFFLPVKKHCKLNINQLNNNLFEKCDVYRKNKQEKFISMEIDYIDNFSFHKLLTAENLNNNIIYIQLIDTYKYLLESIKILNSNNIIHYDLKGENILISKKSLTPYVIDFGLSIDIEKLKPSTWSDYFYVYYPKYYLWCLEIHCISYLLHKSDKLTLTAVNSICNIFVDNNKALVIFSNDFKTKYKKLCKHFLSQFIDKKKDDIINELLKYKETWDNFSISILYLKTLGYIFDKEFIDNSFIIKFSLLLLQNINPYPDERFSINETIDLFNLTQLTETNITKSKELSKSINFNKLKILSKIKSDQIKINK